jgi:glutamate-1-semialdehyde 2,1-aminomutase
MPDQGVSMGKQITNFEQSTALRARAHALIPGGAHTYAKGDDQYPVLSPSHIVRGQGCRSWDADGNCYIEYGMGNRAVTLGHAYEPVLAAVRNKGYVAAGRLWLLRSNAADPR